MADATLQTSLYSTHLAMGARTVPFGGWDMPVQYSGILVEVNAVRTAVGVFDVSHMGRLYLSGPKAGEFLDWVLTGSAQSLTVGRARYCFICNENGGVIDDTIFYRLEQERYLLIPNAGNRKAVVEWFHRWMAEKFPRGCEITDRTMDTALIAVQGPRAAGLIDGLCQLTDGSPASSLRQFSWGEGLLKGKLGRTQLFAGRTGYTGEDGFEIVVQSSDAESLWQALVDAGALPCGLGARDVLRLEAGLPLHGHELDEETSPIEAGLQRFVRFDKEYVGSQALLQQREQGTQKTLVGLTLPGRSAPRQGYAILDQGEEVGRVTSGSYSPTLDTSIAMGYVLERYASPGQTVDIDIRGRISQGEVAPLPFYTRAK